jgi:hypothetical protein
MRRLLLVEFDSVDGCTAAALTARERGFTELDAYLPYPALEVERALGLRASRLPVWVLAFGVMGAAVAYVIQWWTQNVSYPLDVGGRPTNAVAAYIAITFETTVLFASFAAFVGCLAYCKLPRPWHPVFEVQGFERSSVDRFFLAVGIEEGSNAEEDLREALERLGALRVVPVDVGEEGA